MKELHYLCAIHPLGCLMGFEPMHIGITTRGLNRLTTSTIIYYSIIYCMLVIASMAMGVCSSIYYRIMYFYTMLELYPSLLSLSPIKATLSLSPTFHQAVRPFVTFYIALCAGPRCLITLLSISHSKTCRLLFVDRFLHVQFY